MDNYEIVNDEVILLEDVVYYNNVKDKLDLILTSKKMILEKSKAKQKRVKELVLVIILKDIKIYNKKIQVTQKGNVVFIQTINENIKLSFDGIDGILKANKFVTKAIDAVTDTTVVERSTNKIKGAIDTVDDILGIDTRGTLRGTLENGVASTLLKGIKKFK